MTVWVPPMALTPLKRCSCGGARPGRSSCSAPASPMPPGCHLSTSGQCPTLGHRKPRSSLIRCFSNTLASSAMEMAPIFTSSAPKGSPLPKCRSMAASSCAREISLWPSRSSPSLTCRALLLAARRPWGLTWSRGRDRPLSPRTSRTAARSSKPPTQHQAILPWRTAWARLAPLAVATPRTSVSTRQRMVVSSWVTRCPEAVRVHWYGDAANLARPGAAAAFLVHRPANYILPNGYVDLAWSRRPA